MSDNAASNDQGEKEVHPEPAAVIQPAPSEVNNTDADDTAQAVGDLEAVELDASLSLAAALNEIPPEHSEDVDADGDQDNQFDPDTLANLAALSSIQHDDDGGDAGGETAPEPLDANEDFTNLMLRENTLTREQVQEIVDNLGGGTDDEESPVGTPIDISEHHGEDDSEMDSVREDGSQRDDSDYQGPKTYYEDGKLKRRRNRTVLSCTECHRRCDRNIPCSRCIKRGVPSMCRMEAPPGPPKKKKKHNDDVPINYELGLRVQALESLIRSGSNVDAEAAQNAAMETIMQATRAANNGHPEAANALAQLSNASANLGIGAMGQDAQSSLLLDVLQQLSAASMGRPSGLSNGDAANATESRDMWSSVPAANPDSLTAIETAYNEDSSESKLNLTLPGFRENSGKVFIPPTMRHAEKRLREESLFAPGILPIEGYAPFLEVGTRFAYGEENVAFKNQRIASIQAISISGALRFASTFLSRFPAVVDQRSVYVPTPTTEEDVTALREGGLDVKYYRFVDSKTGVADWDGMREDLRHAPMRSAVLLHVSGSTPTGVELTAPQWRMLTTLLQGRQLIPLVSLAFQGLSSGDTGRDAQPLRYMVHEGLPVVLVQSFDAMMGLYGDSPAIVSVATQTTDARDSINSQLRQIARSTYYHPPPLGAQLAHMVLSDPKLYPAWLAEIKAMSDRLRSVREKLYDTIANKLKTPGTWTHLKRAAGMYCSLLLPPGQVEALTQKRQVHLLRDGCISLGCLDAQKIEYLSRSVDWVVREGIREAEEQQAQSLAMELALQAAKEQQAREEAEARAAAEEAEAAAAQAEDALLIEASIQSAMEAQRVADEEETRQQEEQQELEDQVRKAAERAEIARQAELILATI